MSVNKNIIMKQYNGLDYDNLYPAIIDNNNNGILGVDENGNAEIMFVQDQTYSQCYKNAIDNTQWVNPPLNYNTEYKTMKYFLGSPVYYKVFQFTIPAHSTTRIDITHNITSWTKIINCTQSLIGTGVYNTSFECNISVDATTIRITPKSANTSVRNGILILEYLKN